MPDPGIFAMSAIKTNKNTVPIKTAFNDKTNSSQDTVSLSIKPNSTRRIEESARIPEAIYFFISLA
jgi:hypothetical protein